MACLLLLAFGALVWTYKSRGTKKRAPIFNVKQCVVFMKKGIHIDVTASRKTAEEESPDEKDARILEFYR